MNSDKINPDSLKRFVKHLCVIAKKHSDKEAARNDLSSQLSKIKKLSLNKNAKKSVIETEIENLESKISLVLQKEAELSTIGKAENTVIRKLKQKIAHLEQSNEKESAENKALLSSMKQSVAELRKKMDRLAGVKTGRKRRVKSPKKARQNNN